MIGPLLNPRGVTMPVRAMSTELQIMRVEIVEILLPALVDAAESARSSVGQRDECSMREMTVQDKAELTAGMRYTKRATKAIFVVCCMTVRAALRIVAASPTVMRVRTIICATGP